MRFFSIKMKLFMVIMFLIVNLSVLATLTYNENKAISEKTINLSEHSIPQTINMLRLQTCVVQIQQWLTDISATRAADGLDDGFDEAKKYYDEATEIIKKLEDLTVENDIVSYLQQDLDDYYAMGQDMANHYINGGTDEGNKFMATFDPFAEKITDEVQQLVDLVTTDLSEQSTLTVQRVHKNTMIMLIVFAIIIVVSVICMFLISHSITSPINRLVTMLKNISSGNGDLTKRLDLKSKDEIGELASYFNTFIINLHGIISNMVGSIVTVEESTNQVNVAIETANSGVSDASCTLEKVTVVMGTTSQVMRSMSTGINGMVSEMQGITDNVSATLEKSTEIHENSDQGMKNMNELSSIISSVDAKTKLAFEAIEALDKASTEVEKVVEMVRDIADETRLLALNANIEAARAGEQGKGFAVVADQVSKLADESISSVDQIVSIIEHIQDNSKLSFESMLNSRELVNVAAIKVDETSVQFTQISTEIGIINALMNDLMKSTAELNRSSKNVSVTMDDIVETTLTASDQLSDVSAVMEEQVAAIEEVAASMEDVTAMTVDLKTETRQFIIE